MRLSPHFLLEEFTRSETADRLGIDNTPSVEHLANLKTMATALERVRKVLGNNPIIISSGYRSPALNLAVGGVKNSSHALGLAADFTCPRFGSVRDTCRAIANSGLRFDQIIYEQGNSKWVHLGMDSRMRQEALSWKPGRGYLIGIIDL